MDERLAKVVLYGLRLRTSSRPEVRRTKWEIELKFKKVIDDRRAGKSRSTVVSVTIRTLDGQKYYSYIRVTSFEPSEKFLARLFQVAPELFRRRAFRYSTFSGTWADEWEGFDPSTFEASVSFKGSLAHVVFRTREMLQRLQSAIRF